MNKTILLVVFCFSLFVSGYSQGIRFDSYPSHPRLLVKKGEEQKIKSDLALNPEMLRLHNYLLKQCDDLITTPVLAYKKKGNGCWPYRVKPCGVSSIFHMLTG